MARYVLATRPRTGKPVNPLTGADTDEAAVYDNADLNVTVRRADCGYPPAPTTHSEPEDAMTDETIRYTADVVCLTDIGQVLLIERDWPPHEGAWALPGGHVDTGETSRAAAARELLEETGVRVALDQLRQLGVWDAPDRDPRGRYVTVAYLALVPAGTPIVAGDDARTARWWPLDRLPKLAFDHTDILAAHHRTAD